MNSAPKSAAEVAASGLEVKVMDRMYTMPSAEHPLGSFGPTVLHTEITAGKVGGYSG